MSDDISTILDSWQFDPDEPVVRIICGDDGRERVQMRVDLGVLQMEMSGRPDGQRPFGCESLLEYYHRQQEAYETAHPDSAPFELEQEACAQLWREGVQFYHRYLSFWILQRYDLCARDTQHNLDLFEFVRAHASEDHIKSHFDQWRPYVTMMHTRAVATPMLEDNRLAAALHAIDEGIDRIRDFLEEYDLADKQEGCQELQNLERWREEILAGNDWEQESEPTARIEVLRRQLREAVQNEAFEEAASLRDEIRRLSEQGPADA
ncbi:MAG: UvrB/UvrC motif-containing protein [Thermoguttaceae bacterium]